MSVGFEIVFILVLIIANGLFAMSEMAVVSARAARLQEAAERGDGGARAALDLSREPSGLLSTVQIGITLIGILTGAFSGQTLASNVAGFLQPLPVVGAYASSVALGLVVLAISYFSLVLGELAPKRIALTNAERIAARVALPMRMLARVAAPAVTILSASTNGVIRLLGIRPPQGPPVTEEEIRVLLDQGAEAGVFEAAEEQLVDRAFRLGDRRADGMMTPRPEVVWLDVHDTPEMIQRKLAGAHHELYPLCDGSIDQVVGIVRTNDLLACVLGGGLLDLRGAAQPPLYVPESARALKLLERFRETRLHAALVIDEHGGTQGFITVTDLLEALVGELPAPGEEVEPAVLQREDGSWLMDGALPIIDLKELLHIRDLPDEGTAAYQTLGGLVMARLHRIPASGDYFEWQGHRFEVVDMDGRRVDKVLVRPAEEL